MKAIDKTSGSSKEWDYGTILKCWNDSPNKFDLYRIAKSHLGSEKYELDILHDCDDAEDSVWHKTYKTIDELKRKIGRNYTHVVHVKATITIEDL